MNFTQIIAKQALKENFEKTGIKLESLKIGQTVKVTNGLGFFASCFDMLTVEIVKINKKTIVGRDGKKYQIEQIREILESN